jgi:hypothetical protein
LQAFGILTKGLENLLEGSNGQAHHCRDSGEDRIYQIDKEQILWYYYGMWMFRTRQLKQALALAPSWRRAVFVKKTAFVKKQRETAKNSGPFRCYCGRRTSRNPGFPP